MSKFNTAPMRINKRSSDLSQDLQAELSVELSASRNAFTYSPTPDDDLSQGPVGGSWPKISKRRTSVESVSAMSLREVSEALAAAHLVSSAPTDIDISGLDALDALDALVAEAEATQPPDDGEADLLVEAVFGKPEAAAISRAPSAEEEALFALCLPPQMELEAEMDLRRPGDDHLATLEQDALAMLLLDDTPFSPSPTSVTTLFAGASQDEGDFGAHPAVTVDFGAVAWVEKGGAAPLQPEDAARPPAQGVTGGMPAVRPDVGRNGAERKEWTAAEDEIIRQSMLLHGARWRRIAAQLPGRSDDAVRNRWNRLKQDAPKAEPPKEGAAGEESGAISAPPPKRSVISGGEGGGGKPERVSWTKAEDATILQSVAELGHKWNKLAERLPGRTDHAIRNRFHRLQTMMGDKQRQPCLAELAVAFPFDSALRGASESELRAPALACMELPFRSLLPVA